jgi:hypothetical protein
MEGNHDEQQFGPKQIQSVGLSDPRTGEKILHKLIYFMKQLQNDASLMCFFYIARLKKNLRIVRMKSLEILNDNFRKKSLLIL